MAETGTKLGLWPPPTTYRPPSHQGPIRIAGLHGYVNIRVCKTSFVLGVIGLHIRLGLFQSRKQTRRSSLGQGSPVYQPPPSQGSAFASPFPSVQSSSAPMSQRRIFRSENQGLCLKTTLKPPFPEIEHLLRSVSLSCSEGCCISLTNLYDDC